MEKKNTKKTKTTAVALSMALILALGTTAAYLADVSTFVQNLFSGSPITVDVEETTGDEYDVVPGAEDPKDATVKVKTPVDAYAYVVVTDDTQDYVDWSINEGWTEITDAATALTEEILDASGNKIYTGAENQHVYYREVSADDEEQSFLVLKDGKVIYPASLTSEDMEAIEAADPAVTLSFQAYAIQKDPFNDPVKAWNEFATTVEQALAAIDAELAKYDPANEAQQAAAATAKTNINNATTTDEVIEARDAGIKAIQDAATPASTMPVKSDIIKINDKDYRVLSINGNKAFVMSMDNVAGSNIAYDADGTKSEKDLLQYKDSDIDKYLEETWYAGLDSTMKGAIEATTIDQPAYEWTSTEPGSGTFYSGTYDFESPSSYYIVPHSEKTATVGSRHAYLLDVKDVVDYLGEENLNQAKVNKMFFNTNSSTSNYCWLRSADTNFNDNAWYVNGFDGILDYYNCYGSICEARAAFTIDLSQVTFTINE